MIAKDGQPAESDSQSNYEAAVLDFLDKEMADVQSTHDGEEAVGRTGCAGCGFAAPGHDGVRSAASPAK